MMGKHKKRLDIPKEKKQVKLLPQKRQELNQLAEKLLNKCTSLGNNKEEWKDYEEIYDMVQEIRSIEKDHIVSLPERDDNWEPFLSWCLDLGADCKSVEIKQLKNGEYGVIAIKPLNEGELILRVPTKLMMTTSKAVQSSLGTFIQKDPILQHMSNVVLALYLMNEFVNPDSFWKPYISILPSEYNTLLYFTKEEMKELTGSPILEECIKMYRNIARQYSYFYKQFQVYPELRSSQLKDYFTYDFYRWAVSTVMTRQNMVPSEDGNTLISALIPLWDMCNHANGKISTDYNVKDSYLECMAMKDFSQEDEVYIFYGARSNTEFFVHNGFVYPENMHNNLSLKLGVSKGDPLFSLKSQLCSKMNLAVSGNYQLYPGDKAVDHKLLAFLKILVIKEDKIKQLLEMEDCLTELSNLNRESDVITRDALSYLSIRTSLLLKMYTTDIEEDKRLLTLDDLSQRHRMAIQLRLAEKEILHCALQFTDI